MAKPIGPGDSEFRYILSESLSSFITGLFFTGLYLTQSSHNLVFLVTGALFVVASVFIILALFPCLYQKLSSKVSKFDKVFLGGALLIFAPVVIFANLVEIIRMTDVTDHRVVITIGIVCLIYVVCLSVLSIVRTGVVASKETKYLLIRRFKVGALLIVAFVTGLIIAEQISTTFTVCPWYYVALLLVATIFLIASMWLEEKHKLTSEADTVTRSGMGSGESQGGSQ